MGRKPKPINLCVDCKKYVLKENKDYYIVTDFLWAEFGVGRGLLCWGCFQKRLGRKFQKSDFTDCNANKTNDLIRGLKND